MQQMTPQEEKIKAAYDVFIQRLCDITVNPGTPQAHFHCELCGAKATMDAFTAFMYEDLSMKALCNPCGRKEMLRLDYSNKN